MANFRPLQPAPMEDQSPQPQSRPLLTQKPKRTVTLGACVACRKRKSKCNGSRPVCTCCSQKDTECVYELAPNEKPSQAMKRKYQEMQGELSNLRQLYDFLRLRPEQEALEILRRIRVNPPDTTPSQRIQDLAGFVRHGDLPPPPHNFLPRPQPDSGHPLTLPPLRLALDAASSDPNYPPFLSILQLDQEGPAGQRRRHKSDADISACSDSQGSLPPPTSIKAILHPMDELIDPRLESAKDWTKVTNDSHFLALLMSAWHTWEYTYFHFLDWEIFVEDLSSGRTDFCSELLVNALLASACFHSTLVNDRAIPFCDNAISRFYKEARRLWELEEGQDTLPRLQAALCLYMVLGKHGRDKVGHTFLLEACRIARQLGLFRLMTSSIHMPKHVPEYKWEKVRAVTAWTLFNFQLSMAFTYSFPAIITSQPPVAIPYEDAPDKEALFRSECARNIIILECSNALTVDLDEPVSDIPPKPEQIEVLYLKLKSWLDSRPESISPARYPSPENLLAAMQYFVSIVRLFQPFVQLETTVERIRSYREHARTVTARAIAELRQLIILQDIRYGWKNTIPFVLGPMMVMSYGSLETMAIQDQSELLKEPNQHYQGLLVCLKALIRMSNYVYYAQPLFRLLTQTCQALRISLPQEIVSTLDHYQSEEWTKNAASMVSSQYIADIRKTAEDVNNTRMDAIISRWAALTIAGAERKLVKTGQPDS